jgi:hypothetical protein
MINSFDILALGITSIGCFIVGYCAGTKTTPKEIYENTARSIKKSTIKVGPVNRPSSEQVNAWSDPKKVEEDEAFKESFTRDLGDPML